MTHDQQLIFLRIVLREKRENALRNFVLKPLLPNIQFSFIFCFRFLGKMNRKIPHVEEKIGERILLVDGIHPHSSVHGRCIPDYVNDNVDSVI